MNSSCTAAKLRSDKHGCRFIGSPQSLCAMDKRFSEEDKRILKFEGPKLAEALPQNLKEISRSNYVEMKSKWRRKIPFLSNKFSSTSRPRYKCKLGFKPKSLKKTQNAKKRPYRTAHC